MAKFILTLEDIKDSEGKVNVTAGFEDSAFNKNEGGAAVPPDQYTPAEQMAVSLLQDLGFVKQEKDSCCNQSCDCDTESSANENGDSTAPSAGADAASASSAKEDGQGA